MYKSEIQLIREGYEARSVEATRNRAHQVAQKIYGAQDYQVRQGVNGWEIWTPKARTAEQAYYNHNVRR